MRKIRDVLRLSAGGLSKRKIAASLGLSATAAGARRAGLSWPLSECQSARNFDPLSACNLDPSIE
jgi:hypothetical protein